MRSRDGKTGRVVVQVSGQIDPGDAAFSSVGRVALADFALPHLAPSLHGLLLARFAGNMLVIRLTPEPVFKWLRL
jgi:hypothetical protein